MLNFRDGTIREIEYSLDPCLCLLLPFDPSDLLGYRNCYISNLVLSQYDKQGLNLGVVILPYDGKLFLGI